MSIYTGSFTNLPAGLTVLSITSKFSTLGGAVTDLPGGLTSFEIVSADSAVTGALGGLPAGLTAAAWNGTGRMITNKLPFTLTVV